MFCVLYFIFCILYWMSSARARQGLRGSTPPHFLYFSVFCILHFEFCILCFVFCTLYFVFFVLNVQCKSQAGVRGQHAPALQCIYNRGVLYYGPAPCPDPFVPARHDNVFITAGATHLYLVNWPTSTAAWTPCSWCSWPTIYPRLSGPACPPPRDHSLPGFLSTTTQRPSCFRVHHI